MIKKSLLITPDVIEECLCESLEALKKSTPLIKRNAPSRRRTQELLK